MTKLVIIASLFLLNKLEVKAEEIEPVTVEIEGNNL